MADDKKTSYGNDDLGPSGTGTSGSGYAASSGTTGAMHGREGGAGGTHRADDNEPMRQASQSAERLSSAARAEASDLADALIRHVEERPLRALAMLVGIGFVAGWMAAR